MLKLVSTPKARALVATAVGVTLIAGVTVAQTAQQVAPIQWDKRRLDQLDRNVRRLERALTQRNAAGQPVLVEPDPEVVALQGRVESMDRRLDDLEDTVRRVNGELERMSFSIDETERDNAALRTRLTDAEGRLRAIEEAARAEAEANAPVESNSPTGAAPGDLAAAVALTGPARARALETVTVTWPDTPQAREAWYRLGDIRAENDAPGAVQAYAAALRDWPRATWAADATVKLASALVATDRKTQACSALGEFTRRYAEGTTAAVRTRAGQVRTRAGCS
jgi:TolA-binding protein